MENKNQYTLRLDTFPLELYFNDYKHTSREVQLLHYNSFDDAFAKLVSIAPQHYDVKVAKKQNLSFFLEKATIVREGPGDQLITSLKPSMPDRSGDEAFGMPNAGIHLEGVDHFQHFSEGIRNALLAANPDAHKHSIYSLGVYARDGSDISTTRSYIKKVFDQQPATEKAAAFLLEQRYYAYGEEVPRGAQNGVKVTETTPHTTLMGAVAELMKTDMDATDPMLAFNNHKNINISSTIIRDTNTNEPVLELLNVRYASVRDHFPQAGSYLFYHNGQNRRVVEETIPLMKTLNAPSGDINVLVGRYNDDYTRLSPTEVFKLLQGAIIEEAKKLTVHRLSASRTVLEDQGPARRI